MNRDSVVLEPRPRIMYAPLRTIILGALLGVLSLGSTWNTSLAKSPEKSQGGDQNSSKGSDGSKKVPPAKASSDHDWVRLLEFEDLPDPFNPSIQKSTLIVTTAVKADEVGHDADDEDDDEDDDDDPGQDSGGHGDDRKDQDANEGGHGTHQMLRFGKKQEDDKEKKGDETSTRWLIRVIWTLSRDSVNLAEIVHETEIAPPYVVIELESGKHHKLARFYQVVTQLSWEGLDDTGFPVVPGPVDYDVVSEYVREVRHRKKPSTLTILDTSETGHGVINLINDRPDAPQVNLVPNLTRNPILVLSGTKPPDTGILVDDVSRVAPDASTTWSTTVTLLEGQNELRIQTRDENGTISEDVVVLVTLDSIPPPPPVVVPPSPVLTRDSVTLTGSKEPGTAIYINGVEVVPADASTTWFYDLPLQEGINELVVVSVDEAGNESIVSDGNQAEVAPSKPVIGNIGVEPGEVHLGETPILHYDLYAEVPPIENEGLLVSVRVVDGGTVIRTLQEDILQPGGPTGTSYQLPWDLKNDSGVDVNVNRSYRFVVSADRAAPSTASAELVNANPKEAVLLVFGSARVTSDDGVLSLSYRPEETKVVIKSRPVLTHSQLRRLAGRRYLPSGPGFLVQADGIFSGSTLAIWKLPMSSGSTCRPAWWDEGNHDWRILEDSDWDPTRERLSFELPGAGILVPVSGRTGWTSTGTVSSGGTR